LDKTWKDVFIHEASMGYAFKNFDWEFAYLRRHNVKDLMEVTFNGSGKSEEAISCSHNGLSWYIIIDLGKTSLIVVDTMIS
jgi:hypothetical protein